MTMNGVQAHFKKYRTTQPTARNSRYFPLLLRRPFLISLQQFMKKAIITLNMF